MSSNLLSRDAFLAVVRDAPLLSIDLLVEDELGRVLLGWRRNAPARDFWFVPGGRVRKDESLDAAFTRLCFEEIGLRQVARTFATFLGVYEHFYPDNALSEPNFGTHYVVLAYRLSVELKALDLPKDQHVDYRWGLPAELLQDQAVHVYSQAYLTHAHFVKS